MLHAMYTPATKLALAFMSFADAATVVSGWTVVVSITILAATSPEAMIASMVPF